MDIRPSEIQSILDKPAMLMAVDRTVDLVTKEFPTNEEERLANLMIELTALCLNQAKLVVRSAHDMNNNDPNFRVDFMYYVILEADNRWSMVRQYLQDTRQIEIHPLMLISIIRNGLVNDPNNQTELDRITIEALDRYADTMKETLGEILGVDNRFEEIKLPSIKNDPELLMRFFEAFKALGVVHRKKSEYQTEEQKQAYDKLMAIYDALTN